MRAGKHFPQGTLLCLEWHTERMLRAVNKSLMFALVLPRPRKADRSHLAERSGIDLNDRRYQERLGGHSNQRRQGRFGREMERNTQVVEEQSVEVDDRRLGQWWEPRIHEQDAHSDLSDHQERVRDTSQRGMSLKTEHRQAHSGRNIQLAGGHNTLTK
jgi:hypothetical protein